jgi:hypothetical protein
MVAEAIAVSLRTVVVLVVALQPFGLAEPLFTLRIFGEGAQPVRVLSVGNLSPVGGEPGNSSEETDRG